MSEARRVTCIVSVVLQAGDTLTASLPVSGIRAAAASKHIMICHSPAPGRAGPGPVWGPAGTQKPACDFQVESGGLSLRHGRPPPLPQAPGRRRPGPPARRRLGHWAQAEARALKALANDMT